MSDERSGVILRIPLPTQQVFRYQAADDILELLYRNPHREFTVTQLRETTDHGGKSVDNALAILGTLDLIQRRNDGRKSLVRIDQTRIQKPDDPILEIPQEEFRTPIQAFLDEATQRQAENLVAVILFGSVARGNADRASDIDIQVVVADELLQARRDLQSIRQNIEERRFDGNRYEIQLLVESVESAKNYGEKLQEIFSEGIELYATEAFADVKEVVFDG